MAPKSLILDIVPWSLGFFLLLSQSSICQPQTPFVDITEEAGIDHQFLVYEGMFGGGVCVFDINNDGLEDLYITGGMNSDVLYLNQGQGSFKNIFSTAGLEITGSYVTQGISSADVDKDGWVDLFITTITSKDSLQIIPRAVNLLLLNNGDLTFRNATTEYGLDPYYSFSTGANFGDVNADGYPDIYVGNYFLEYEGSLTEINDATIVGANQTAKGYLLINHKGRYFTNEYQDYGLDHRGFGFGGVFTDFDNDHDQDLIVNHDFGYKAVPSYLLENQFPKKEFRDISEPFGMDLKINAMGAAVGDYDNNGLLDYFITNIRFNHFMVNQGSDHPFIDRANELGMHFVSISWGANFADFDHDGDLDLFVSNGDLNPNCVPMANFYFENHDGRFTEKARLMGLNDYGVGRGSAIFDLENDGDMDILVVNQRPVKEYPDSSRTKLFRNDLAAGNYLKVALQGLDAVARGLGSRIEVVSDDLRMIREVDGGGSSHISQNSPLVHFGLGSETALDSVIVTWTGGKRQYITNPSINTLLVIEETVEETSRWPWIVVGLGACVLVVLLYFKLR